MKTNAVSQTLSPLLSLSDDELMRRLVSLLGQSRRLEADLLDHMAEVDARRLYAREASSSMFTYCTDVLHLSKAEAYLRICAARASRRHPVLRTMLAEGRIHLSGIAVLAPHLDALTDDARDALLARAAHESKDAIKELVAELAPKPDVPATIRKLPASPPPVARAVTSDELHLDAVAPSSAPIAASPSPPKPPAVEPLAPARYKVQFTASTELRDKLQRLAALMPGADLAAVVEAAVTEKLKRLEAKRFARTDKPRMSLEQADTSKGSRNIPAAVRRTVYERDQGRCTFVSDDGRRCTSREQLEFHHDEPHALGGDRSPSNIWLVCRAHNAYLAELDYGKDRMDRYRRRADRVGEPPPTLQLRLDRVARTLVNTAPPPNASPPSRVTS